METRKTEHFSLYPSTARLAAAFKDELAPHLISKGTLRFALDEPVPVKLIEHVAKFRAKEEAAHAKANALATKRRRQAGGRPA